MKTVSLFDWNGELYQQVQDDEVEFNIKLTKIEGSECMGFTSFKIEGEEAAINYFLGYYELELDPEGRPEVSLGDSLGLIENVGSNFSTVHAKPFGPDFGESK